MQWLTFVLQFLPQVLQLIMQAQQQFPHVPGHEKKALVLTQAETLVQQSALPPVHQQAALALADRYIDAAVAVQHADGWQTP